MSLTANSSLESAKRIFFINTTYSLVPRRFFLKRILYLIQCCIYRSVPKFASARGFLGRTRRGGKAPGRK